MYILMIVVLFLDKMKIILNIPNLISLLKALFGAIRKSIQRNSSWDITSATSTALLSW